MSKELGKAVIAVALIAGPMYPLIVNALGECADEDR